MYVRMDIHSPLKGVRGAVSHRCGCSALNIGLYVQDLGVDVLECLEHLQQIFL